MDNFSWTDNIKAAIAPCLSCLQSRPDNASFTEQSRNNTTRTDLEGLLRETDDEAETLSLHSNVGNRRQRTTKRLSSRNITIFGYNIFGKPPIRLEGVENLSENFQSTNTRRRSTISSSTLDSDAAPLDSSTIDRLSESQFENRQLAEDRMLAEEERRKQKEERRKRRRERRQLRPPDYEQEPFEGFPGSGTVMPPKSTTFSPAYEDVVDKLDADLEGADFEADMYTTRTNESSSRRSGSDSRSRTSASISNPDSTYRPHVISQQPRSIAAAHDTGTARSGYVSGEAPHKIRRSKSSSKTSSSKTSQSPSLLSPVAPSSPTHPTIYAQDQVEFEGFPNDGMFPIVRFGGGKMRGSNTDMGVALARRGGDS